MAARHLIYQRAKRTTLRADRNGEADPAAAPVCSFSVAFRQSGGRAAGVVVIAALLWLGLAVGRASAAAPAPIPTCTSSIPNCTPPPLLNNTELTPVRVGPERPYAATPAEVASLHAFERQAVENTLRDHHLPAGDAAAVESWGRADALAELWGLVVQAIHASHPTADQRNVVAWLTAVMHRRAKAEADAAGWSF